MKTYTVNFLVKDIIGVEVCAEKDNEAIEKAREILNKELCKSKRIECIDGLTKFAGFNIDDVWAEIND